MILAGSPARHLTYCTNIHPGESWPDVLDNLRAHVTAVKAAVSPERPFGVGLRLSAAAARALAAPGEVEQLRAFLRDSGLYVFTINGFPHGAFSGIEVKERVYRPDWLEEERVRYSGQLASLLASLLADAPAGLDGSVSTVPGCFAARGGLADVGRALAARLLEHARALWQLREETGRTVALALEPEPACLLETTADAAAFFDRYLFSTDAVRAFAWETGLPTKLAEQALRRHLGVCLDACHAAVEFETPAQALAALDAVGVRVLKVQVSAGLRVTAPDSAALAELEPFAEDVYLHQVVVRAGKHLRRFVDLPPALADAANGGGAAALGDEWRVHFHVPLFLDRLGRFENTSDFVRGLLALLPGRDDCRHLEVETYTWDVLPAAYRDTPVVDAIARELRWTLDALPPSLRTPSS
ncbi:MAG TPA: metabolite traffic protein EboE [Polyangia bacterium]|nr:metabolite traffic protein EboE [Polyangia bacterium]